MAAILQRHTNRGPYQADRPIPAELMDRLQGADAEALAAYTRDAAWQPTFVFRVGYPERPVPPSPRRPVREVVI